jgi:hypothetical protein
VSAEPVSVTTRVNVSMLSLKWGDVLSTLLPGALVVLAVAPYVPLLQGWFLQLDKVGPGVALLMASVLAGEILGALTRIFWERLFLVRRHPSKNVLPFLCAQNLDLYERGIQGSYKYVTFYANFAWAVTVFLVVHLSENPKQIGILLLVFLVGLLLRASFVQWTYFVNYQTQVFGPRSNDVGQRSAAGNASTVTDRQGDQKL